jgi:multiple sugar transport system ATP-binding protein
VTGSLGLASVSLRNIDKFYGRVQVLKAVDVEIVDGDFAVILGPSGCGKSTLLRVIAGLEEHQGGDVLIGNELMNAVPAAERSVGMLFQSYALFPHLNVSKNISFGMRMRGEPKAVIAERVARAAKILQLEPYLDRLPKNLSGGQRQRVAIGRSIVREPKVFLFDEPLSNLDAELRVEMRLELAKLHDDLAATMIYVTHDQIEAMTLGTKIIVMHAGVVQQIGTPLEVYYQPANRFVAGFIGSPRMQFLKATVEAVSGDGVRVRLPGAAPEMVEVPCAGDGLAVGDAVEIGVRPEDLHYEGNGPIRLATRTVAVEYMGHASFWYGSMIGQKCDLIAHLDRTLHVERGASASFSLSPNDLYLFDGSGRARHRLEVRNQNLELQLARAGA